MERLPLEALCHILSYLNHDQRLNAGLVCKRWLHASDPLLDEVVLKVLGGDLPDVTSGRHFTSFRFRDTIINDSCVKFLNRHTPLHLQFKKCEVQQSTSTNSNCSELLTLETDSSDVLSVFQHLPSLKKLTFTGPFDMSTRNWLDQFDSQVPSIGPRLISFIMPEYMPYNNRSSYRPEFLFDHELFISSIERLFRMRAVTLKFVQFPLYISADAILSVSQIENLKLESVIFANCINCGTAIGDFCQNQPSITALKLNCAKEYLQDADFGKIFHYLPALREFDVSGSYTLDRSIVRLFAQPTMRKIHLYHCYHISPESFLDSIKTLACFDLRVLKIFVLYIERSRLQESHILKLLPLLPRLNELILRPCPLSNEGFREATLHLTSLRTLELSGCHSLSGSMLGHLTDLRRLHMSGKGLTREGLLEGVRFPNLKDLHLSKPFPNDVANFIRQELRKQNPRLVKTYIG